eukprot:g2658.t1
MYMAGEFVLAKWDSYLYPGKIEKVSRHGTKYIYDVTFFDGDRLTGLGVNEIRRYFEKEDLIMLNSEYSPDRYQIGNVLEDPNRSVKVHVQFPTIPAMKEKVDKWLLRSCPSDVDEETVREAMQRGIYDIRDIRKYAYEKKKKPAVVSSPLDHVSTPPAHSTTHTTAANAQRVSSAKKFAAAKPDSIKKLEDENARPERAKIYSTTHASAAVANAQGVSSAKKIAAANSDLMKLKDENARVKCELQDARNSIQILEQKHAREKTKFCRDLENAKDEEKKLRRRIQELDESLRGYIEMLKKEQSSLNFKRASIQRLTTQHAQEKAQLERDLQDNMQHFKSLLETSNRRCEELESAKARQERELNDAHASIQRLTNQHAQEMAKLRTLKEEVQGRLHRDTTFLHDCQRLSKSLLRVKLNPIPPIDAIVRGVARKKEDDATAAGATKSTENDSAVTISKGPIDARQFVESLRKKVHDLKEANRVLKCQKHHYRGLLDTKDMNMSIIGVSVRSADVFRKLWRDFECSEELWEFFGTKTEDFSRMYKQVEKRALVLREIAVTLSDKTEFNVFKLARRCRKEGELPKPVPATTRTEHDGDNAMISRRLRALVKSSDNVEKIPSICKNTPPYGIGDDVMKPGTDGEEICRVERVEADHIIVRDPSQTTSRLRMSFLLDAFANFVVDATVWMNMTDKGVEGHEVKWNDLGTNVSYDRRKHGDLFWYHNDFQVSQGDEVMILFPALCARTKKGGLKTVRKALICPTHDARRSFSRPTHDAR